MRTPLFLVFRRAEIGCSFEIRTGISANADDGFMSFCRAQKKRKKTAGGPTGFWKEMKTGPWLLGVFGVPERTFQGFTTGETDKNWDGTQVLTRIPPMNANELQMDATERGIRGVGREDF